MPVYTPAQIKAIRRKFRNKKRERIAKARGVEASRTVEATYFRDLKGIVLKLQRQVNADILPLLASLEAEYIRDNASLSILFNGAVNQLQRQPVMTEAVQLRIATRMAKGVESFNRRKFVKEINDSIGLSLRGIITKEGVQVQVEDAVAENIDLIKSIPEQYHDKLRSTIQNGISRGDDFFSLKKTITDLGQSTINRAKFIARDQVAKLNAVVTEARQTKLGITSYFWRTAMDERVRDSHAEKEGDRFDWASPPPDTGHPGQDFQCRCIADPDLSTLLDSTLV
jgi:SPP1 gp7 family putative phage head morphogenesis protein